MIVDAPAYEAELAEMHDELIAIARNQGGTAWIGPEALGETDAD